MIGEVKALGRIMALSFRALFGWMNPVVYLSSMVIGPMFQLLFFVILGGYSKQGHGSDWYLVGNAIQLAAWSTIFAVGSTLVGDRQAGTLSLTLIAPRNKLFIFLGRSLVLILHGLVNIGLGFLTGWAVFGLDLARINWPGFLLAIFLTTLTTGALGLVVAALNLVIVDANMLLNLMVYVLLMVCGINFSPSLLPLPLQWVSSALPLTRGVAASRLLAEGNSLSAALPLLGGEVLVGVIYLLLGFVLFLIMERQARRVGNLDIY